MVHVFFLFVTEEIQGRLKTIWKRLEKRPGGSRSAAAGNWVEFSESWEVVKSLVQPAHDGEVMRWRGLGAV